MSIVDEGVKSVIVSIIENIRPASRAADLVLALIAEHRVVATAVPALAHEEKPTTPKRKRRTKSRTSSDAGIEVNADDYYPVSVVQAYTGYAPATLYKMLANEPERLHSKKVDSHRLCLGADIIKLRAERVGNEGE